MRINIAAALVLISLSCANAQVTKYLSVEVGVNQSSFYLPTNPPLLQGDEFNRLFSLDFTPSPEFLVQFNFDIGKKHTVSAGTGIVSYRRTFSASTPIFARYDYRFAPKEKSFFLRGDIGYSFFLASGLLYGFGPGYQLGNFRFSIAYNNQLHDFSVLEDGDFVSSRVSTLSLRVEYSFFKKLFN